MFIDRPLSQVVNTVVSKMIASTETSIPESKSVFLPIVWIGSPLQSVVHVCMSSRKNTDKDLSLAGSGEHFRREEFLHESS